MLSSRNTQVAEHVHTANHEDFSGPIRLPRWLNCNTEPFPLLHIQCRPIPLPGDDTSSTRLSATRMAKQTAAAVSAELPDIETRGFSWKLRFSRLRNRARSPHRVTLFKNPGIDESILIHQQCPCRARVCLAGFSFQDCNDLQRPLAPNKIDHILFQSTRPGHQSCVVA